jgi:hypothetical protein
VPTTFISNEQRIEIVEEKLYMATRLLQEAGSIFNYLRNNITTASNPPSTAEELDCRGSTYPGQYTEAKALAVAEKDACPISGPAECED